MKKQKAKITIKKIDKFKDTKFSRHMDEGKDVAHCLIFPCYSKKIIKYCYNNYTKAQDGAWSGDIMTITTDDYKKLIEKSRNLEIIESLSKE